ncbi:MAG TPA: Gldg family protein, partial [Planctomycetota bacterium]
LEHALEGGTSVIVAGASFDVHEEVRAEVPYVAFAPAAGAFGELATHFGLRAERALVLDTRAEELEFGPEADTERLLAPHWVRCIAPQQDFHRYPSQPNGTLLFRAASPLLPEPARLAELGWTAEVLGTSSDETWLARDPPRTPVELARLVRVPEAAAPKQALMVALRPDHPWHGELVFLAAETPFADGFFRREHVAHPRLLDVLLKEATSNERLVLAGIDLARPAPLRAYAPGERLAMRAFVLALPVLLLVLLVHGRELAAALARLAGALARTGRRLALPVGALGAVLLLVRGARALDAGLDLTDAGLNALAPAARAVAARSAAAGAIEATLLVSPPAQLPPALRPLVGTLEARLDDFARAGAPLRRARRAPEDLAEPERAALAAHGLATAVGATSADGVTRVARYTSALRLARGGSELVLDFSDARAFERLEFRLANALERLAGLPARRIAFASDVPRLSAAEAYEYQKQSLFAPGGSDVYALARAALARNDLLVEHVNPRAPVLPEAFDALVWLQPRRSIEPMLEAAVRALHGGATLILAAQHFSLKPQQFRGGDFEPQFWPQPQNPDLEHLYLPELGIELVREVLFDALCLPIQAEAQLTGRQGAPDFERQASALPFQIRLSSAGYAAHPMMRGLGDQAFLFANRIRWDAARLAELGLTATPLAFTSPATWSFAWKGGWIPHELLRGPAELEGSSGTVPLGPQPLVVLFEGTFPRPVKPLELNPSVAPEDSTELDAEPEPEEPWPAAGRGRLVLIGDSAFLTNGALTEGELRGDHLLWNAVATTVFEGELVELATRVRVPRGFGLVAPRARLLGRAFVLATGPLLLLAGAAGVALLRRRPPVRFAP